MSQEHTLNGLWTVEFGSSTGKFGGGTVVFRDGKILGGDATYYYVGDYTLDGNNLRARMKVSPFMKGAQSVFDTIDQEFALDLIGTVTVDDKLVCQGFATGIPQASFGARLTRRG